MKAEFGAKRMGLDMPAHPLFLDTADFGPLHLPSPEQPHLEPEPKPRPDPTPGTFRLLIYGR